MLCGLGVRMLMSGLESTTRWVDIYNVLYCIYVADLVKKQQHNDRTQPLQME